MRPDARYRRRHHAWLISLVIITAFVVWMAVSLNTFLNEADWTDVFPTNETTTP
jgi:hypothetical protein